MPEFEPESVTIKLELLTAVLYYFGITKIMMFLPPQVYIVVGYDKRILYWKMLQGNGVFK